MTRCRSKRLDFKGLAVHQNFTSGFTTYSLSGRKSRLVSWAAGDTGQGGTEHENKYSEVGTGSKCAGIRVGYDAERPGAVRNADEARETGGVGSTDEWSARAANGDGRL